MVEVFLNKKRKNAKEIKNDWFGEGTNRISAKGMNSLIVVIAYMRIDSIPGHGHRVRITLSIDRFRLQTASWQLPCPE
jgi:hypothetical protein